MESDSDAPDPQLAIILQQFADLMRKSPLAVEHMNGYSSFDHYYLDILFARKFGTRGDNKAEKSLPNTE